MRSVPGVSRCWPDWSREAQGRDVPRQHGAASTVAWLRDLLRITPADARTLVTFGEVLDARPALADAVADGAVNTGQATAIGRILADVPATESGLVDKVETILIGHAAQFEPRIFRRLGERHPGSCQPGLGRPTPSRPTRPRRATRAATPRVHYVARRARRHPPFRNARRRGCGDHRSRHRTSDRPGPRARWPRPAHSGRTPGRRARGCVSFGAAHRQATDQRRSTRPGGRHHRLRRPVA